MSQDEGIFLNQFLQRMAAHCLFKHKTVSINETEESMLKIQWRSYFTTCTHTIYLWTSLPQSIHAEVYTGSEEIQQTLGRKSRKDFQHYGTRTFLCHQAHGTWRDFSLGNYHYMIFLCSCDLWLLAMVPDRRRRQTSLRLTEYHPFYELSLPDTSTWQPKERKKLCCSVHCK